MTFICVFLLANDIVFPVFVTFCLFAEESVSSGHLKIGLFSCWLLRILCMFQRCGFCQTNTSLLVGSLPTFQTVFRPYNSHFGTAQPCLVCPACNSSIGYRSWGQAEIPQGEPTQVCHSSLTMALTPQGSLVNMFQDITEMLPRVSPTDRAISE